MIGSAERHFISDAIFTANLIQIIALTLFFDPTTKSILLTGNPANKRADCLPLTNLLPSRLKTRLCGDF